jgi:hypothetical protein
MDKKRGIWLCLCGMCPSFVDYKEEIAYCLAEKGASRCIRTGVSLPGVPCSCGGGFLTCLLLHPW